MAWAHWEAKKEDFWDLQASLGYRVRTYLKTQNRKELWNEIS